MRYQELYDKTLELGKMKLAAGDESGRVQGPRIGTGGGFSGIFAVRKVQSQTLKMIPKLTVVSVSPS